eukprot:1697076-Heterocapsa_arctica.AAC.1
MKATIGTFLDIQNEIQNDYSPIGFTMEERLQRKAAKAARKLEEKRIKSETRQPDAPSLVLDIPSEIKRSNLPTGCARGGRA